MNKEKFTKSLKYGKCGGSKALGEADNCIWNSSGEKLEECPLAHKICNCCVKCRANCIMGHRILEYNRVEQERALKELKKVIDESKDEIERMKDAAEFVKNNFGL